GAAMGARQGSEVSPIASVEGLVGLEAEHRVAVSRDVGDETVEAVAPSVEVGLEGRACSVDGRPEAVVLELGEDDSAAPVSLALHVEPALAGQDERADGLARGYEVVWCDDAGDEEVVAALRL